MSYLNEYIAEQSTHGDLSDLSVFDADFEENKFFSHNPYTGEFEKVEGRKAVFLNRPETKTYKMVAPVSPKYKLINHVPLFDKINEAILKNDDLSVDNLEITDTAYDNFTKVHRSILFKDHEDTIDGTGIEGEDKSCLRVDILNSTDTSWKFQVFVGRFREFCQNTQVFGGKRYFHILKKHTSGFNVAEESRKISNATGDFAEHGEHFYRMLQTPVTADWVIKLFKETVARKEAVKLNEVAYQDTRQISSDLTEAMEKELTAEELEKQVVNFKLFGALMARFEDEINNGMGMNMYTVYNALTNWSSHVGGDKDTYENDRGLIVSNTNKGSKLHNVRLDRQKEVIKVINSPIWEDQLRSVA